MLRDAVLLSSMIPLPPRYLLVTTSLTSHCHRITFTMQCGYHLIVASVPSHEHPGLHTACHVCFFLTFQTLTVFLSPPQAEKRLRDAEAAQSSRDEAYRLLCMAAPPPPFPVHIASLESAAVAAVKAGVSRQKMAQAIELLKKVAPKVARQVEAELDQRTA